VDSFGFGEFGRVSVPADESRLGMTVSAPAACEWYVTRWCASRRPEPSGLPPLSQRGFLFGGSTARFSGAMDWLSLHDTHDLTAVASRPIWRALTSTPVYHTNGSKPLRQGRA